MAKQQTPKEAIIVARYSLKRNGKLTGAVIYRVRSSQPCKGRVEGTDQVERDGQWYNVYKVSCFAGKTTGCTCPAHSRCYHRTQLDIIENNYPVSHALRVVEQSSQPVVSPEIVAEPSVVESPDPEKHYWSKDKGCYCYRSMPKEPVAFLSSFTAPVVSKVVAISTLNGAQQQAAFWSNLPSRQKKSA